ncbi:Fanconi anemia group E protein [Pelodytes ibericus]
MELWEIAVSWKTQQKLQRMQEENNETIAMECPVSPGFEGVTRLLLQALGSSSHGTLTALRVMQNFPGSFPWKTITERLCMEVPTLDGSCGSLVMKPALFLLPKLTQRNLFSFLNIAAPLVPSSCSRLFAEAVSLKEGHSDGWLNYLSRQLLSDVQLQSPSSSPNVMEKVKTLCKGLSQYRDEQYRLGWCKQPIVSTPRKRKASCNENELLESDSGHLVKRLCIQELCVDLPNASISQEEQKVIAENQEVERRELPEHMEVRIHRLKEILHGDVDTESWDDSFQADLKELCESCTPEQLHAVFSSLAISNISPQSLLQLCCQLHSISPDLSYAHSSELAKSLFLEQMLFLTTPAPRPIISALSMFCLKYAQSACSTLFGPLLRAENGSVQTDFLCRMVSECLQPEHLPLCISPVLEVPCCEGSISVLHMLLERQVAISRSAFEQLLLLLCHSAEMFSKSVMFSKLLLNIMTRNQSMILPDHLGLLSNALNSNQTFMKKTLQGILNRFRETIT